MFENQHFGNVLGYHAKYYNAMAWALFAENQAEFVDKNNKECGKCVTMCKIAVAKFEQCKDFVNLLGG